MNKFLDFLSPFAPLSKEVKEAIKGKLQTHNFPKNHIVVKELSLCNHLYFIEEGLARIFYYKDGKEVTQWFAFEGTVFGPLIRNYPQKPGPHTVQLLEASCLTSIDFDSLQELFDRYHEVERIGRMLAIQVALALQNRLDSLQFETAEQRYNHLLQTYPSILHRVSLGHIASFLGVTQVTLSRIRAKT